MSNTTVVQIKKLAWLIYRNFFALLMSFVLLAQRPCLKFFASVVHNTGHYCMFTVHASLVALTQVQRFFRPLVTNSLLCNCCLPLHTHTCWLNHPQMNIAYLPLYEPQPVHLESLRSLCSFDNVLSLSLSPSKPSRVIWWSG